MAHQIKAALFDIDGLVLVGRTRLFSERLAATQGIPIEAVLEFFEQDFKRCSFGQADLKEVIAPYLPKWKWKGSVADLLSFWFSDEGRVDSNVLDIVKKLRTSGVACYIATRQEKYRMRFLHETLDLRRHFDGTFCTCDVGYDKNEPAFFEYVLTRLGLEGKEVLFFDDKQVNVDTAKALGIDAHFYDGIHVLEEATREMLG